MAATTRSLVLVPLLLALVAADWPQFLGPHRDGVSAETGLNWNWPPAGPPVVWQRDVGGGFTGVAIAGGRLILFHRLQNQEVVECLDAATGQPAWKFAYPTSYQDDFGFDDGPRATPTVGGGRVFTLGADGDLHALDLATGAKVWGRNVNADFQVRKGYFGVGGSPLLEGDRLLVNVGGKGAGVVAFDAATGKTLWQATDHEASYASPTAATIGGRRWAFCFTREGLVALDPATGTVAFTKRWRARMAASVNAATPLVVGDQLFLTASYQTGAVLLRVKPDGAEEIWKGDDVLSCHYNTPVVRDGFLYGLDGRAEQGPRLRCVEWATGKVRWTKERFGCASLILAEGRLLALTDKGELAAAEATPEGYRETARAAVLTGEVRAPLALADGRAYGRTRAKLVCWNLKR